MLRRLRTPPGLASRGDTIVEVMVVLAVLGLALGISYATANQSLMNTRQAEENAQATRYVQAQLETLYDMASQCTDVALGNNDCNGNAVSDTDSDQANNIYSWKDAFCSTDGTTLIAAVSSPTPSDCTNYNGMYQLAVYYCDNMTSAPQCSDAISGTYTFVVQVTWPDVAGQGTDSVTQTYRIHPGGG